MQVDPTRYCPLEQAILWQVVPLFVSSYFYSQTSQVVFDEHTMHLETLQLLEICLHSLLEKKYPDAQI